MKRFKSFFILIILVSAGQSLAQQSLEEKLKYADSISFSNRDEANKLILQIRSLAGDSGHKNIVCETFLSKGNMHYDNDEYDDAILEYESALQIYKEFNDTLGQEKVFNNLGASYALKGDFSKSLESYLNGYNLVVSSKITAEHKDRERVLNYLYLMDNLGNIYLEVRDFKMAIEFFGKVVQGSSKIQDDKFLSRSLLNLSKAHFLNKEYSKSKKYILQAIRVDKSIEGERVELAEKYSKLARIHLDLNERSEAKIHLNNALSVMKEDLMYQWDKALLFNELAYLKLEFEKPDESIGFSLKAYEIAKSLEAWDILKKSCSLLRMAYEFKGVHKEALKYSKELTELLSNSDTSFSTVEFARLELEMQYQKRSFSDSIQAIEIRNEEQNKLVQKNIEIKNKRVLNIVLIIGIISFVVLTVLLLVYYRRKLVANSLLKKSLGEKEVLLKEVHHRVKNNFQVISSLLNLQLNREIKNPEEALKIAQSRIQSMALVHRKLYASSDFEAIEMQGYLEELVATVVNSNTVSGKYNVDIDAEGHSIELDKAIPLGLIFNELITNFFKYVVRVDDDTSLLSISIRKIDSKYEITIRDNGPGFPDDLDIENLSSLGLELVAILSDQIDGELEIKNLDGAFVKITV